MITISLCMIVKNEASILPRCLDSIKDLVDEIIIVDTGSTDSTKEIAKKYTNQVYDYTWKDDFSAARNFSFSKATKDYIYTADADEVLDDVNRARFLSLKNSLLTRIEIVQMKYVTKSDFNTVMNFQKEYRPKLYKRLRNFSWIDPIHETVRLEPVVYDSDIEIHHMPVDPHQKRDFSIFLRSFEMGHRLSRNIQKMYAKELFISGDDLDFQNASNVFSAYLASPEANEPENEDLAKEASLVLLHIARITGDFSNLLKFSLNDMLTTPCAEACNEIGEFFFSQKMYDTAIMWFYNAAFEAESILTVHSSGDVPLKKLSDCYTELANDISVASDHMKKEYIKMADQYLSQSKNWTLPEE